MKLEPKRLTTEELKFIIDHPKNVGVDGARYAKVMDSVFKEYALRLKYKAKDEPTLKLRLLEEEKKKESKNKEKYTSMLKRLEKARAAKKKKAKYQKKVNISVTVNPAHKAVLEEVGNGVVSKGLSILVERYIKENDELFS